MLSISFLEVRSASTTPRHQDKARWSVRVDHGGQQQRTRFIKLAGKQQEVSVGVASVYTGMDLMNSFFEADESPAGIWVVHANQSVRISCLCYRD